MDNYAAHTRIRENYNVKNLYLPKNTTAKSQPLDSGVINDLKLNYKRFLIEYGVKPNLRRVLKMASDAWYMISPANMRAYIMQISYIK